MGERKGKDWNGVRGGKRNKGMGKEGSAVNKKNEVKRREKGKKG